LKKRIENSDSIPSAKPIAQLLRNLKETVEEASRHNFWIRVKHTSQKLDTVSPPVPPPQEDKLQSLKRILLVVLHDVQIIITSIKQVLDTSILPQEVIQLVKVIKELKQKLESDT